jgi:hypothetical protein
MTDLLVATGVEHSGTGLLARILATSGLPVIHRAMPHVFEGREVWWDADVFRPCRFVIIERAADPWFASTVARGLSSTEAYGRWSKARRLLPRPDAWMNYEELVAYPDRAVSNLAILLGVALTIPEPIYDGNAKWKPGAAALTRMLSHPRRHMSTEGMA